MEDRLKCQINPLVKYRQNQIKIIKPDVRYICISMPYDIWWFISSFRKDDYSVQVQNGRDCEHITNDRV